MDRFGLGQNLNSPLVTHTGMGLWAEGHSIPCETLEPVTDGATIELGLEAILISLGYPAINPDRPEGKTRAALRFRLGELIGIILGYSNNYASYAGYQPTRTTTTDGFNFGYMKRTSVGYSLENSSNVFGLKQRYFASNLSPCDERDRVAGRYNVFLAARTTARLKQLLDRLPNLDERRSFMSQVFARYFGYSAVEGAYTDYLRYTNFPYGGFSKYAFFNNDEADYLEGRSDTLKPRPVYSSVKPTSPTTTIVSGSDTTDGNTTGGNTTGGDTIIGNLPQSDPSYTTPADDQTTTMDDKSSKKSGGIFPLLALGVAAYFATKE